MLSVPSCLSVVWWYGLSYELSSLADQTGRVAFDHPARPVGLDRSSYLGGKPQPHADAVVGHMHVDPIGLTVRFCRNRRLIGAIDRLRMRPEEAVVLVYLAELRGAERYILAEFHIVCLDSDHRGRQNLLAHPQGPDNEDGLRRRLARRASSHPGWRR